MLWYNPNATIRLIFSSSSDVWLSIWCAAPIWWTAIRPTCSFPSDVQRSVRRAALRPTFSFPSNVRLSAPTCGSPPDERPPPGSQVIGIPPNRLTGGAGRYGDMSFCWCPRHYISWVVLKNLMLCLSTYFASYIFISSGLHDLEKVIFTLI